MNDLYRSNPWEAMSGKWPNHDLIGEGKSVAHWNDGHYGLIVFKKEPTNLYQQEFLRKYLPGWCINVDGIKGQQAFRTTNGNWRPLVTTATLRPNPRKFKYLVMNADNPTRFLGRFGGQITWVEQAEAEENDSASDAADWRDAVIPCGNPSNGVVTVREYR